MTSWITESGGTLSNGPDCVSKPSTCCNPCTHTRNPVCKGCCVCVPRTICVRFDPDESSVAAGCYSLSTLIDWQWNADGVGSYFGSFHSLNISLTLEDVTPYNYETDRQQCRWVLDVVDELTGPVVDQQPYPLTRGVQGCPDEYGNPVVITNPGDPEGGLGCRSFSFTFAHTIGDCTGTITIAPYEMERVPFRLEPLIEEYDDPATVYPACGLLSDVCRKICVEYKIGDSEAVKRVFLWDVSVTGWSSARTCPEEGQFDYLFLIEDDYGQCWLRVHIQELDLASVSFAPCLDEFGNSIDGCVGAFQISQASYYLGEIVSTSDAYGNTLSIWCGRCDCWKRICGDCRCVCKTLCMVYDNLLNEGEGATYVELEWDETNNWWGDEYFHVDLTDDGCGGCAVRLPYELGVVDLVPVDGCDRNISFTYQAEDFSLFVIGGCKNCTCSVPIGCCGDQPLPLTLYADVVGDSFGNCGPNPYGGPICPCLSLLSIRLDFVPQVLECQAVWIGYREYETCAGRFLAEVRVRCCDSWDCQVTVYANEDITLDPGNDCHGSSGTGTITKGTLLLDYERSDLTNTEQNCDPFSLEFNADTPADPHQLHECPNGLTVTVTE